MYNICVIALPSPQVRKLNAQQEVMSWLYVEDKILWTRIKVCLKSTVQLKDMLFRQNLNEKS